MSVPLGLYLRSDILCLCIESYFPLSLLSGSVWSNFYWGLSSIWIWVLCMMIDMGIFSFFYMLTHSMSATFCILYFMLLCQKPGVCVCVDWYQGLWLNTIGPSVLMPIPGCFLYYSSVEEFEVRNCDTSRSSFIVQDYFGNLGFFCFSTWIWVFLFKGLWRIFLGFWWGFLFDWFALNLEIAFVKLAIFTTLILPTKDHGRSFHFLASSSISFFKD